MIDEESPPLLDNEIHANGGRNYSSNNSSTNHTTHSIIQNGNLKNDTSTKINMAKTAFINARGSVASTTRAYRPRLVAKDGDCLIQPIHLPHHYRNMYRLAIRFVFYACILPVI